MGRGGGLGRGVDPRILRVALAIVARGGLLFRGCLCAWFVMLCVFFVPCVRRSQIPCACSLGQHEL